ncbi:hypothetical protein SUDANB176_05729 [Streptomyces sp. enrichment culture]|uniref:caspase, EACC1-associated type n=1 Tax=Streptomyces sp. enrichment culture TaxID=1795815 RepID=UPI003F563B2C
MSAGRHALLVATGRYDDQALRRLRSPVRDAEGLAQVLGDPRIGDFEVSTVVDGRHHEVTRAIEHFFLDRRRDDLLLLHLSCHGIKDDNGELHFATTDTDRRLLASTSVPAAFLHTRMRRCRARSIVLLLDCCYSGAFLPGAKGDTTVHVRDELAGHGRVVLTATNRTEYAWEGERLDALDPEPSRFTGAVIRGLSSGEADRDRDGLIDVRELYDYVYDELRASRAGQSPLMWAEVERQVVVARSVLHPRTQVPEEDGGAAFRPVLPAPRPGAVPGPAHAGIRTERRGDAPLRGALARMALITEAMCELPCMEDAQGRLRFAMVLGEHLNRRVDVRGVRMREDVAVMVRAALNTAGGLDTLFRLVEVFEGRTAAADVRGWLERSDRPAGGDRTAAGPARGAGPSPGEPREDPGGSGRSGDEDARGMHLLVQLVQGMSELPCMEDAQGRVQFATVLGDLLGRPVDLRGVRLREDVLGMVRAALTVPGGDRLLVEVTRIFAGNPEAEEIARVLDTVG